MHDIVLMSDPEVTTIPVHENGEPLIDLRDGTGLFFDPRLADPDGAYAHVRRSVADRLLEAQRRLLPHDRRLLVVEAYRPLALQTAYFERYADEVRQAHPEWSAEVVRREASRSLSPPDIAPHVCGAAVDVTLCTPSGSELPLGGEVNADPEDDNGACYTAATGLPAAAAANRRLLVDTLTAVGLVNYPTEWWHWSYGDRYWAMTTGATSALYDRQSPPPVRRP